MMNHPSEDRSRARKRDEEGDEDDEKQRADDHLSSTDSGADTMSTSDMYLGNIAAACADLNAQVKRPYRSEEEKQQERRAANRKSAKMSRDRKKMEREQLQDKASRLAQVNLALTKENQELRQQIAVLLSQQSVAAQSGGLPIAVPGAASKAPLPGQLPSHLSPSAIPSAAALGPAAAAAAAATAGATAGLGLNPGGVALDQPQELLMRMMQEQQRKRSSASLMAQNPQPQQQFGLPANFAGFAPTGDFASMLSQAQVQAQLQLDAATQGLQQEQSGGATSAELDQLNLGQLNPNKRQRRDRDFT